MSKYKLATVAGVLCLILPLTVGCSSSNKADAEMTDSSVKPGEFLTREQTSAEYYEAAKTLSLPEGYEYPEPRFASEQENIIYEKGVGAQDAFAYYECAWEITYLENLNSNPDVAAQAFEVIKAYPEQPIFQEYLTSGNVDEYILDMIERASLGDPSKIQGTVEANCDVKKTR